MSRHHRDADLERGAGMNLRQALRIAKDLGAVCEVAWGTGEYVFRHPLLDDTVRCNLRRKDATRNLVVWLRALQRATKNGGRS